MRADVVYVDRRSGELDHQLLGLMRDSGCGMVYCGFESVNPATLAAYNKHQAVQDIRRSVRAFHDHSIHVHGMFVLGADTDDADTFQRTVDLALHHEIDTVQFLMLTPCPGTPFYDRMAAQGRLLTDDLSLYDGHHCVIEPALMSPYELQTGTYKAMARFYSVRYALRLIISSVTRNLPFLLGLLWRERRLRWQLPRVALFSLLPSRRKDVLDILQGALSRESWKRLRDLLTVPLLRLYGRIHIRQWARQARTKAYIKRLRRLISSRHQPAAGSS
jgi:radical SAM superfamily enzyme YgiQ (UPF0313 family)